MKLMVAALSLLAASCGQAGLRLTVDVRTDLSPTMEFGGVHAMLDAHGVDHLPVAADDWMRGARVAELDGLAPGAHTLDVSLMQGGRTVVTRRVDVTMRADLAVTVVMARSCAGIVCPGTGDAPDAITCVDGRCASPACGTAGGPACPMCTGDADCAVSSVVCAPTRCSSGTCLRTPDDALCASGLLCDVAAGCVSPSGDGGAGGDGGLSPILPLRTCQPCAHDAECGTGFGCLLRSGTTAECLPRPGVAPPIDADGCTHILDPAAGLVTVDGATGTFCVPPVRCAVLLAWGMPCTMDHDCGVTGTGGRCTTAGTCSYECTTGFNCPSACDTNVCR